MREAFFIVQANQAQLAEIARLIDARQLWPVVGRSRALDGRPGTPPPGHTGREPEPALCHEADELGHRIAAEAILVVEIAADVGLP
jgi:hypothetical protein